jgi:TolB-like protein
MRRLTVPSALITISLINCPVKLDAQYREVTSLAATLEDNLSKLPNRAVAVVDFTDLQGSVTELGRFLAEELSVSLVSSNPHLRVIDRTHLKALLQEHKLAATGIIDPATARKLGEIAGVQILVTGTITPFGDAVRCAVKALDTETAEIFAVGTAEIPRTRGIEDLLSRGLSSDAGAVSSPSLAVHSTPGESSPHGAASFQWRESHQFSFALIACKLRGELLTCSLQITNQGKDRQLGLATSWGNLKTRVISELGNEFVAERMQLGSETNKVVHDTTSSGVPMIAETRFSSVPPRLSSISLLEITCLDYDAFGVARETFSIQFRDVPVN